MYIFIGLGTPKNGFEKKFVTKLCPYKFVIFS
jgi:hypothetical protein